MTIEEFEKSAIGIETGYTDRNGTPIKVGDSIILYNKCKRCIDEDEDITEFPKKYVVGSGHKGYVYTGKIIRQKHEVRFYFEKGLCMTSTGKYGFLYDKDKNDNLKTVLVWNNKEKPPVLSFDDLVNEGG